MIEVDAAALAAGHTPAAPAGPGALYALPTPGALDPQTIAGRLVDEEPEFAHLKAGEAAVLFLMRMQRKEKAGRVVLGQMAIPRFTGALGDLGLWALAKVCGCVPDFVMWVDHEFWVQATPQQREALVYHELCHAIHGVDKHGELRFTQDGDPIWDILGHDIEEFDAVAKRYGAWLPHIESFVRAVGSCPA